MTLTQRLQNILSFQDTKKKNLSSEIGASGTQVWNGTLVGEEYLSTLDTSYGGNGFRIYNEMRRSDPIVRATLKLIEHTLKRGKWYVEPAGDSPQDKEIAEFVNDALFNRMTITWNDILRLICTQYAYGFMVFEKVFIEEDGKIYWKKWAFRSQTTIEKFQTKEGEDGITQQFSSEMQGAGGNRPSIPLWKLLVFTHEKEGDNWRGTSLLRGAYKPYYFKSALEKIEAIGYERQSVGVPIGRMPIDPDPQDKTTVKELLENLRANEKAYALLPSGWEIEMLDMKGNMTKEPGPAIMRKNWEIAINVLAPHVLMGAQDVGSFALAKVLAEMFINSIISYAEEISDTINSHAVKQLVDLNYPNVENYPTLAVTGIQEIDVDRLAVGIAHLSSSGFIAFNERDEDYLREVLGLPELDEDGEREDKTVEKKENVEVEEKEDKSSNVEVDKKKELVRGSERFWRNISAQESGVNFDRLEQVMDSLEDDFTRRITFILEKESKTLNKAIETAITTQDPSLLLQYQFKYKQELVNEVEALYFNAIDRGKVIAANEIGRNATATSKAMKNIASLRAEATADNMMFGLLTEARFSVIDVTERGLGVPEALKTIKDVMRARMLLIISRASSSTMVGGLNLGRKITHDEFKQDIYSLVRSELLDNRTCNYCLSVDGRSVDPDDEFADIDQFHFQCRGIWFAVLNEEAEKPPITGVPKNLRDRVGTITQFKQMAQPEPLTNSLADEFVDERGKK